MPSTKDKLLKEILNTIPILSELEDLVLNSIDEDLIKKEKDSYLNQGSNRIEKINNMQTIQNISSARKFAFPSSIYGHRYGSNIMAEWDLRANNPTDLYLTDKKGLLKNGLNEDDALERVKYAKDRDIDIIYFFGGSTIMSMGARTPGFSIPALVEKILKIKYQKEVVCLNYGLGGTCCREAMDLYIHDARMISSSAKVVFYDGWNCAAYLTLTQRFLEENNNIKKNLVSPGDTSRTIEHNYTLSKIYSLNWHLSYVFKILIAKVNEFISPILPKKIRNFLYLVQKKFFSLSSSTFLSNLRSSLDSSDFAIKKAVKKAVIQYIDIHRCLNFMSSYKESNFMWFQQPLVFWGNKPLSDKEKGFRSSGYSSGDPRIYYEFEEYFKKKFKSNLDDNLRSSFFDLTNVFNNVKYEVYLDSGHLNRLGNLIIGASLADTIYKNKNFLK